MLGVPVLAFASFQSPQLPERNLEKPSLPILLGSSVPPASESLPLLNNTPLRPQVPSASTRLTRCAKRPQPSHDISDSHIPHPCILSILCQQDVALVHRDQKAGSFFWDQVAADC